MLALAPSRVSGDMSLASGMPGDPAQGTTQSILARRVTRVFCIVQGGQLP